MKQFGLPGQPEQGRVTTEGRTDDADAAAVADARGQYGLRALHDVPLDAAVAEVTPGREHVITAEAGGPPEVGFEHRVTPVHQELRVTRAELLRGDLTPRPAMDHGDERHARGIEPRRHAHEPMQSHAVGGGP